ncbi:type II toxin-antitoxin system RelE/ParE family toxin [Legionella sp. W05-934-2]|uniref:type II toxin-antitoxin system RelE/ParE family toxin n=1 Tax=Legionella sp. W05-934-2 TaxID=1198649 RepID=UPI00346232A8
MNKKIEYIAYQGESFTIEWYYDDNKTSDALEYYNSLNKAERIQLLKLLKRMGDNGEIKDKTKFRNEGDKIYAFKPQPDRFLCFFCEGKKIVITNGFRKKQQKLPLNEKDKALNSRNDYINRVKRGEYYE